MRLDLGSPVRCTDEAFGELADVVIDPETRRVTHLVVQPHQRGEQARLVPVDRARAGETSDATISLSCTIAEMSEFELVRERSTCASARFRSGIPIGRSGSRSRSRFLPPWGWTPWAWARAPSTSTRT